MSHKNIWQFSRKTAIQRHQNSHVSLTWWLGMWYVFGKMLERFLALSHLTKMLPTDLFLHKKVQERAAVPFCLFFISCFSCNMLNFRLIPFFSGWSYDFEFFLKRSTTSGQKLIASYFSDESSWSNIMSATQAGCGRYSDKWQTYNVPGKQESFQTLPEIKTSQNNVELQKSCLGLMKLGIKLYFSIFKKISSLVIFYWMYLLV